MDKQQGYNYHPTDTNGDTHGFVAAAAPQPAQGPNDTQAGQTGQTGQAAHFDQYPRYVQAPQNGPGAGPHNPYPYPTHEPYPYVPPTPILYTGLPPMQAPQPRRRFTAGTVLIPLAFMFLHLFVLTVITLGVATISAFNNITDLNVDLELLEQQLLQQNADTQLYVLLIASPLLIGLYLLTAVLLKQRAKPYVYFDAPRPGYLASALVMGLGCVGVANLMMMLFQLLSTNSAFIKTQLDGYIAMTGGLQQETNILLQFLALCVLVPIAEELLFRGIIAGEFRRAMPDWLNIVLNGLLFALFHMNFIQSSYVLIAGLALSALGLWSRSIWVPILLHAVYNFSGSVAITLIGDNEEAAGLFFIVQLVCIALGLILAFFSYRRRKPAPVMV